MADNIINAVFGSGICAVTTSAYRANYGMKLRFSGIELPTAFEVDFSNYDVMGRDSITMIGQDNEVQIPDDLWDSGLNIYAYVYLHPTDDSGVTVYTVTIPVLGRPNRTEEQPTPHEQSVIEQAISALNDAVEQTAADVVAADASASAAAQSEANASASERAAAASASAALASQNAAESAQRSATESATNASESARNAANSAAQAAESATAAQESAEQAEQSAQSIEGDVERAERAAATATEKATEASASATAAAQSASSASTSVQNAASSATAAESSATDAEQAKTDAQDAQAAAETAQAAAEQAAESVSGLSEQIAQNAADIADLVQSKAGVLVDTATGSIASFVPDSTVPTVKGLTVDVDPVQDLHGYDHPWPSGGGKNKANVADYSQSMENVYFVDKAIGVQLTAGVTYTFSCDITSTFDTFNLSAGAGGNGAYRVDILIKTNQHNGRVFITFTPTAEQLATYTELYVRVPRFSTPQTGTFSVSNIQLELGSIATAYSPYSNICPISGWDSVDVWDDPKYGGTVAWNQWMLDIDDSSQARNWGANNGTVSYSGGKITFVPYAQNSNKNFGQVTAVSGMSVQGHIYIYSAIVNRSKGGANIVVAPRIGQTFTFTNVPNGVDYSIIGVFMASDVSRLRFFFYPWGTGPFTNDGTEIITVKSPMITDLTLLFGSTIADYIYNLEQANEGAGVAYFRKLFPNDYYPFDNSYTETCVSAVNGDPYLKYTIPLGQTVYGGTVDVTNGVLTVDRAMVDLGSLSWSYFDIVGHYRFVARLTGVKDVSSSSVADMICSMYTMDSANNVYNNVTDKRVGYSGGYLFICDSDYTDATTLKTAVTGQQLVYELATPLTIQLDPVAVSIISGQTNNIWADSGNVSVEYAADLKTYIDNKIAAAYAALS